MANVGDSIQETQVEHCELLGLKEREMHENKQEGSSKVPKIIDHDTSDAKRPLDEEETQDDPIANKKQTTVKDDIPEGMSKSQWKKLKKKKYWESKKDEIRQHRKEKKQLSKQRKREQIEELLAKGESIEQIKQELMMKNRSSKYKTKQDQKYSNVTVIFDCGFDDKMNDRERISLGTQISRSYGENRRADEYIDMKLTSFKGNLKERFETKTSGYENWKNIEYVEDDLEMLVSNGKLDPETTVYLSADEKVEKVETLESGHTYIIGGLVDKGRYKNLCHDKAKSLGLKTARLPIDEFIQIAGRRVLTSLHVFLLLSKWIEVKDWKKAFEEVLPERKQKTNDEDGELSENLEEASKRIINNNTESEENQKKIIPLNGSTLET